jgi:hypothetical protein
MYQSRHLLEKFGVSAWKWINLQYMYWLR